MAGKNEVKITITGDKKKLKKTLDDAESDMGGFKGKVGDWAAKLGKLAVAGVAVVAAGAIAAGAGLLSLGADFDDMYDNIRVGTGATGEAFEGLQESAKNVLSSIPTDFEAAGTAIADVNTRLDLTGPSLETVSSQFLRLSDLTGGDLAKNIERGSQALKQFNIPAEKSPKALDHLFKVSQATGISFDELSDLMTRNGAVLQSLGYDFEQSASLVGQLEKAGVDVQGVLGGMGKGLATLAKAGEDPKEAFSRLTKEIATMDDPIAASQKAIELFGSRGGAKLAAELRAGRLNIDEFNQSILANGETILGVGAETDDWKEKLQVLKNKALVALEPVAMKVFDALGDVIEKVTPTLEKLAKWVGEKLPPFIQKAGEKAAEFGRKIGAVLKPAIETVGRFVANTLVPALAKFGNWLMNNKPVLTAVAVVIGTILVAAFVAWGISAASAAVATLAALAPIIAVIAVIGAVVAALVLAYNKWDGFKTVVDAVAGFLKNTLWPILKSVGEFIGKTLVAYVKALIAVWSNVLWPALKSVGSWISGTLWPILRGIATVFTEVGRKVGEIVGQIVAVVVGIATRIKGPVSTLWNGLTSGIRAAKDVVSSVVTGIVSVVKGIGGRIGSVANSITGPFRSAFDGVKRLWNNSLGKFSLTIPDIPGIPGRGRSFSFPKMHTGGIVPGRRGVEVPTILQAGEMVIPADVVASMRATPSPGSFTTAHQPVSPSGVTIIVKVDASGALMTADMPGRIVELVEQGIAAGHQTPRLARSLSR